MLSGGFMPSFQGDFTRPVIHSFSTEAIGSTRMAQSGSTPASSTWPAANQAIYVPFIIPQAATFQRALWYNGATVSGNVDVGIYDENGTLLGSTGAVAQSGTSAIQTAAFSANISLQPGRYYMAISCSSGTATMFAGTATLLVKMQGMLRQATAHPLPSSATFATWTSTIIPLFAISTLGVA